MPLRIQKARHGSISFPLLLFMVRALTHFSPCQVCNNFSMEVGSVWAPCACQSTDLHSTNSTSTLLLTDKSLNWRQSLSQCYIMLLNYQISFSDVFSCTLWSHMKVSRCRSRHQRCSTCFTFSWSKVPADFYLSRHILQKNTSHSKLDWKVSSICTASDPPTLGFETSVSVHSSIDIRNSWPILRTVSEATFFCINSLRKETSHAVKVKKELQETKSLNDLFCVTF